MQTPYLADAQTRRLHWTLRGMSEYIKTDLVIL